MKKTLALLLSLVILCTCAGCENEGTNKRNKNKNQEPKTETIILTEDNFEEYFNINTYTSDYYEDRTYNSLLGIYTYDIRCNLHIEISKTCDFEVQDVKVTFHIITFWDYVQDSYTADNSTYIDIKLPQNGEISKTYNCSNILPTSTPTAYFKSVTGTIIIEK